MTAPFLPKEPPRLDAGAFSVRGFGPGDVAMVVEASRDPMIRLVTTVPAQAGDAEASAFVERQRQPADVLGGYSFVITERGSEVGVGSVGLWTRDLDRGRASIGYWVLGPSRRRGAARGALAAVSDWALGTLGVQRLELYVEPHNTASVRTAESVGFAWEGLLRSFEDVGGERRDMALYALLPAARP